MTLRAERQSARMSKITDYSRQPNYLPATVPQMSRIRGVARIILGDTGEC